MSPPPTARLPSRVENLFAIADLGRTGDGFRSLRDTATQICQSVTGMPGADLVVVARCDPEGSIPELWGPPELPPGFLAWVRETYSALWSPVFEAYTSGREVVVDDLGDLAGRPDLAALAEGAAGFGLVSAAHVAVTARGRTLGTLNLWSRTAIRYTPDETDLLHAIARAAGIALDTALIADRHGSERADTDARHADLSHRHDRLAERLTRTDEDLAEVMRAQAALAGVLLESGIDKVDAICALLADTLGAAVMVFDTAGKARAFGGDPTVRAKMTASIGRRDPVKLATLHDGEEVGAVSVHRVGYERVLGVLLVHPGIAEPTHARAVLLRHAIGLVAFELEADRAESTARDIARPAILHALVRGNLSARQSHAVGKFVDVTGQALRIGFMRTTDDVTATAVSHSLNFVSRGRGCLAAAAELDGVLLLLEDRDLGALRQTLSALLDKVAGPGPAEAGASGGEWTVGLSEAFRDLSYAPQALEHASVARAVAGRHQIALYEDLGATAALLRHVPPAAAAAYVDDVLNPLIEYDRRRKGALVRTVTAYLRHRGSLRQAAVDLGVHENTVQLRLARASQLMGSDLHDPQRLGLLAVALSWHHLLGEGVSGEP